MHPLEGMRRLEAPIVTVCIGALVFAIAAALGTDASTGAPESETFVNSAPWSVWRLVAAMASVFFLGLLLIAVRVLTCADKWGIASSAATFWTYFAFALAATGVLLLGRLVVGGGTPELPVKALDLRIGAVLLTALLAGIPWLVLVWRAHDTCHLIQKRVETLPPIPRKPDASSTAPANGVKPMPHRDVIDQLLRLWDLIGLCIGAFALAVLAATVTSSSLRAAFLDAYPDRADEFPAVNVLYYGLLFAAFASVLNLPLIAAWRRSARSTVNQTFPLPPDGQPTEDWVAARTRLEALLHLDVSLLRNPLTALTILSPILTSALAAFIPQIGRS